MIKISFKVTGFDELQKYFNQMGKAAKKLQGQKTISFDELFTFSFMTKYTQYESFDEFLKAGGFEVNSQEDFEAIPDADMDTYVSKMTSFRSWQNMLDKATEQYISKKLGF